MSSCNEYPHISKSRRHLLYFFPIFFLIPFFVFFLFFFSSFLIFFFFLVADTQLYKSLCPSVGPSVGPSVNTSGKVWKCAFSPLPTRPQLVLAVYPALFFQRLSVYVTITWNDMNYQHPNDTHTNDIKNGQRSTSFADVNFVVSYKGKNNKEDSKIKKKQKRKCRRH